MGLMPSIIKNTYLLRRLATRGILAARAEGTSTANRRALSSPILTTAVNDKMALHFERHTLKTTVYIREYGQKQKRHDKT